ncbi:MAG: sulfide/dihydroorotate dehydrogenase-like FAD/NAD-binding protein [Planctomycetaceae bacterium]|jgi:ferredoxin--NADP+ reductase|nr:sulfide/dihydroorotate dehydrogenase-like FAD/NAD-binding protein [Planctomycetaceae bacterium]
MFKILSNKELVPNIYEMTVVHPRLAKKAQPGHFVIVMPDECGERIPLTIADFDRQAGTVTLVIMAVGTSTMKLVSLKSGSELYAIIGPLGTVSEIEDYGTVIMVAGGVGTAPVFPIARSFYTNNTKVISIQGVRTKELLFWTDKLAEVSDIHIITTDDGSAGRKGLVTEPLREILESEGENIGCVYMIGPAVMMKFCSQVVTNFGVKSIASLNSIMIDGTGMCGGCRVKIGDETKFTCVDGPEFDASQIDWDILLSRQKMYCDEEKCSLNKYKNTLGIS